MSITISTATGSTVDWTSDDLTITSGGSISATPGIEVSGTVGALENDGTITSASAIVNGGAIASITNTGTISGQIDNSGGTIGLLNNSGTISAITERSGGTGKISHIVNSGTIGGIDLTGDTLSDYAVVIQNTGTIAGPVILSGHTDFLTIQGKGVVTGSISSAAGGNAGVTLDPGAGQTYVAQSYIGQPGTARTNVSIGSGTFQADTSQLNLFSLGFGSGTTLALTGSLSGWASPMLSGFGGGDLFYLVDTQVTAASLNANNQLVLTDNGATVATFKMNGYYTGATFTVTPHGSTGTDITVSYTVAAALANTSQLFGGPVALVDSAANVAANLDRLEILALAGGTFSGIELTDANTPTLSIAGTQLSADFRVFPDIISNYALSVSGPVTADSLTADLLPHIQQPVAVSDRSLFVSSFLDTLQSYAAAGKLTGITLTDSGFGIIALSSTQVSADSAVLNEISGNYVFSIAATQANQSIAGSLAHGTTVVFSGAASEYGITTSGSQVIVTDTGTGRASVDHLSGITAIQFADHTAIVAQTPGSATVTSGNVTELYAAVFGRLPDVPGLNYYEAMLAANPSTPLTQLAQSFLASPEYVNNPAHAYSPDSFGDTLFISDSYYYLLGRAPESGAVPYYLNLIATLTQGAAPGTAAYASAEAYAHAVVLTDFSASAEFLNDVTITGQNPPSAKHWLILTS